MRDCSEVLRKRRSILLLGTILVAAVPVSGAFAAEQAAPTVSAPAPEWPKWYFFGGLEAGDRFFGERPGSGFGRAPPPENWLTPVTTQSRAKFEEYGEVRPGAFLDWINLQTGTTDGRYALDFWGRSVGLNNQSYSLDASELGRHYLSLGWDQTPHLISTSAKTIFGGVGTSSLTVPNSVQAALQAQLPNAALAAPPAANGALGQTARANIENIINSNLTSLQLWTQRDKATAGYRFTPTPDWDFGVDYSHEHRNGVRPTAVSWGFATAGAADPPSSPRPTNVIEIPQPLNDTTQNVEGKGEYVGTTFWGTRWTTNLKYNGSFFDQDVKQIDIENPFCLTCSLFTGTNRGPNALRWAPPPSNNANAITSNTAVDLPFWTSRFVNTFQYNAMRQDDAFVNTGTNGTIMPPVTLAGVPVGSLDGKVDTFLWNGVYTGRPIKDLQLTIRGRHYDIDNRTPSLHIDNWIWGDSGCAGGTLLVTGMCAPNAARNSLPISYTKDNASGEATWRPAGASGWAGFGGGVYWERYDRHLRDVNVTNELSGKTWVDLDPIEYVHAKVSYLYAQRRYDEYNAEEFVKDPGLMFSEVASNMRKFDIANRNRQKAELMLEWTPGRFVTFSPNAGLRWDDYPDDVFNPLGVRSDHSWNAGLEIAAMVQPTLKLMVSYNYEDRRLNLAGGSGGANFITGDLNGCPTDTTLNPENIIGPSCTWRSDINQRYHTFMAAADWKVVPSRFDLRLEYLYSRGSEANTTTPCSAPLLIGTTAVGTNCAGLNTTGTPPTLVDPALVNGGQFPQETNTLQRFNVIGRYYVDPMVVQQMGFKGDVTVKVRYTWEKNENSNWAIDNLTPYVPTADTTELTGANRSLFLAAYNPNYSTQIVAVSTVMKW